jgi:hypothetical protein
MVTEDMRTTLSEIADLLDSGQEVFFATAVRHALNGPEERLEQFLVSNNLWGGSGSVADSAFAYDASTPDLREKRKEGLRLFENLMIKLGRAQIDAGHVNVRTCGWVEAFEKWQQMGLR